MNIIKNGRAHVIEMANRASVQKLASENLSGLTTRLDNHESGLNHSAHIIANVAGLREELDDKPTIDEVNTALDSKAEVFTGYTGSITYVKTVNYTTQVTTTGIINVSNGIIVSIT